MAADFSQFQRLQIFPADNLKGFETKPTRQWAPKTQGLNGMELQCVQSPLLNSKTAWSKQIWPHWRAADACDVSTESAWRLIS
jgi:hypothetical protein